MRSHGVPNFPDPGPGGLVIPNSINPASPAFRAGQKACASSLGPGNRRSAPESQRRTLLNLAKCIRAHGLPNFSDPTTNPPPPNHAGGNVLGIGGVYLAIPAQSPAFRRAANACGLNNR